MPSPVRFVAEHIWLLLLAVLLGCFTGSNKDELKALREANRIAEDARREQAERAQVLLVLAPLGVVGNVVWAVIRGVRLMMRPRPEDGLLTEYLLTQPNVKSVYWDPGLLERAKNLRLTKEEIEQAVEDSYHADDDEQPEEQPSEKEPPKGEPQ